MKQSDPSGRLGVCVGTSSPTTVAGCFYVRNGRRMVGDFVLTEAHLRRADPRPVEEPVGLIWWPPDLHHARRIVKNGRVWNEGAVFESSRDADWIPCGIPYRCLVPRPSECTNLLTPTCPSSSYVAYGAYRIEFTFMVAAQSAATAAVMAIEEGMPVQDVSYSRLREALLDAGQVLVVPRPEPLAEPLSEPLSELGGENAASRE